MRLRGVVLAGLVLAGVAFAWIGVPQAFRPESVERAIRTPLALPSLPSPSPAPPRPRKCVGASGVLYTTQNCPSGAREQPIDGGAVTVVPALVPAQRSDPPSAAPLLRSLAPADGTDLKERQMQRIVDQIK